MKWYRIRLQLRSWFATPWLADTVFGHLCWGMVYLLGEQALAAFLQRYSDGEPPLLLSNGFPGDYLPCPIISLPIVEPTAPREVQEEQFDLQRALREKELVTLQEFNQVIRSGDLKSVSGHTEPVLPLSRVALKNQLNRVTCTTGAEGTLYSFEEYFHPEVVIFAKIADDFVEISKQLFEHLAQTGFGKRKSVGYGQVAKLVFEQFSGFAQPVDANGFVTLSNFVPAANDPIAGNWRIIVKYGKMGEERATGGRVFKKPLVMLTAGSTFYDAPCREYYGRLVFGLNPAYPDAIHYGLALPVPMRLPG